jgi:hypothetical protein
MTSRSVSDSWHFLGFRRVPGPERARACVGRALPRAGRGVEGLPGARQLMAARGMQVWVNHPPTAGEAPVARRGWRSDSGPFFELDLVAQRDPVVACYQDLRLQVGAAVVDRAAVQGSEAEAATLIKAQPINSSTREACSHQVCLTKRRLGR